MEKYHSTTLYKAEAPQPTEGFVQEYRTSYSEEFIPYNEVLGDRFVPTDLTPEEFGYRWCMGFCARKSIQARTFVAPHEGLISIGLKAFSSTSFNEITLPSTLTSIGKEAFSYSKITSIIIPEGITEIPDGLFAKCRNIKYVNVLGRITSIGKSAFVNAINLEYIYIPNSVLNIGELAFVSGVNNFEIHYEGTETEWNSITKPDNWNNSVYCTIIFNA
jgi:hypothetical protein